MLPKRIIHNTIFFLLFSSVIQAQKITVDGYIKDMQTIWKGSNMDAISNNLIHNRININAYMGSRFRFHAGIRNRLTWGDFLRFSEGNDNVISLDYASVLKSNSGYYNLSWNVVDATPDVILNTTLDRLYLDYSYEDFQVTIGRQRINWGVNLVWNPNDIFNAFSFFDFDYEEHPGVDAVRVQYYTGYASSLELVYQLEETFDQSSMAGLWRLNALNYDFQVLAGKMKTDLVVGGGWAGDLKGAGFRGEGTFFLNPDSAGSSSRQFVGSVSVDYMFSSGLFVNAGFLYNSQGLTDSIGSINYLLNTDLSPKTLSFARWSVFTQFSYPITPILNADMACMVNPIDGSFFVSPTLRWNVAQNIDISLIGQLFNGAEKTEFGGIGHLYNLRFKYSF